MNFGSFEFLDFQKLEIDEIFAFFKNEIRLIVIDKMSTSSEVSHEIPNAKYLIGDRIRLIGKLCKYKGDEGTIIDVFISRRPLVGGILGGNVLGKDYTDEITYEIVVDHPEGSSKLNSIYYESELEKI